jgi:tetratricopeptide (TPR) repeat protein
VTTDRGMLDRIARGLAEGTDMTAGEILDVLWLAAMGSTPNPGPSATHEPGRLPLGKGKPASTVTGASSGPVPRPDPELHLLMEGQQGAMGEPVAASEVGLAAPRPIKDAVTLPAVLRRLRLVSGVGPQRSVDIEATVDATAEAGRLTPVLAPRPERALDLALVVDDAPSMRIWKDTFDELQRLLVQSGAFRGVSRWDLDPLRGEIRPRSPGDPPFQSARRLIDPSGRRLVLVATDARAAAWFTKEPWNALTAWSQAMPTAVIQVLPQHYWAETAIGDPYIAARARRPAAPNAQYQRRLAWWAADDPGGVPLPVVTLAPESIWTWAQALVTGTQWATGITAVPPEPADGQLAAGEANPADLVNEFLSRASPGAQRLARVLASAPVLSMPLIEVLRSKLAPETGVLELAEILASALLEVVGQPDGSDQSLRYRPRIREILRRGTTAIEEWDAYTAATEYVRDHPRLGGPMKSLIADAVGQSSADASKPFAALELALAMRLGLRVETGDASPRQEVPKLHPPADQDNTAPLEGAISGNPGEQPSMPDQLVIGLIPQLPQGFQSRENLMDALRTTGPEEPAVRVLTGMGGAGKTQLAAAYARECMSAGWRLVAWVNAETTQEILYGLALIADRLGLTSPERDLEATAARLRGYLEAEGDGCLLVFDNVFDTLALSAYLPRTGGCQVVVTSRVADAVSLGIAIEVGVYTPEQARAFLAERTGLAAGEDAAALAAELGYLPLALAQAAAVIGRQRLTYEAYLSRLRILPVAQYLTPQEGQPYPRGVAEAIILSIDEVTASDRTGLGARLLNLIALLSQAGVSSELLHLSAPQSAKRVDSALARLASASLLSFTSDGAAISAHRLVTRVVRERQVHDGTLSAIAMEACVLLETARSSLGEAWQSRLAVREWIQHVTSLAASVGQVTDRADDDLLPPLLSLRGQAMIYLLDLGDSAAQAVEFGEPLLFDNERILGSSHVQTLASRGALAAAYLAAGRLAEAIPLYERTLAESEHLIGESHPDTLAGRNNLANAYQSAGRLGEAISLFEETLAVQDRVLGSSHPDTLTLRNNLAYAYASAGRVGEAISLFEAALLDRERVLGSSHPSTLATRGSLATAYQSAGRLGEAISLLEETLAVQDRVLGSSHPDTLAYRNNLANVYESAGRIGEAVQLYEQVLADSERTLGPEHPFTATVRENLANAARTGKYNVTIRGSSGVQVGDGNIQVNNFGAYSPTGVAREDD